MYRTVGENIDSLLIKLATEETKVVERPSQIHPEGIEWIHKGKLPEHFNEAQQKFQRLLEDDQWYGDHEGKYVALLNEEEIEDKDLDALLTRAYEMWGYRPIFTALATRDKRVSILRPRDITHHPQ